MAHRLIHLAIYQGGVCSEETPADLTLLWNFGPEAELRTEDETFALRRDDVVSLRPQQRYSLRTGEGPVAAVALDGAQLRACLGGRRLAIRCNSAREVSDNYAILRGLLGQVLQAWAEGGPYLEAELGKLYYELALLLANCFSVDLPGEPGTRAEQFTRYLEDHCREELSLQQISEAFHMTPQYFSRQFKAQTGQNFYRSLTAVRLRRAKQDLAETDTPLLRLALDNGFANLESFYHYFQEDTGQTPQAWRDEAKATRQRKLLVVGGSVLGVAWLLCALYLFLMPKIYGKLADDVAARLDAQHAAYMEVLALRDRVDLIRRYEDHSRSALEMLRLLCQEKAENVIFQSFTYNRDTSVRVVGLADDTSDVYGLKDALQKDRGPNGETRIAAVNINRLTQDPKTRRQRFDIEILFPVPSEEEQP